MFEKDLWGKTDIGHRRRLRARRRDGAALCRAWRRADHLRPADRGARGDGEPDARRFWRQGRSDQLRCSRWRRCRCHDGGDLARWPARCSRQQCCCDVYRADRATVVSRRGCHSRANAAWHDVLHVRCRQTLDRSRARGRGAEYPLDLDHHRSRLHGAVGHGEISHPCDDQKSRRGVGTQGHPQRGDRAGRVPDRRRNGQLRPEGRDQNWAREIRSAGSASMASWPILRAS